MKKLILYSLLAAFCIIHNASAQQVSIDNFILKENLLKGDKLMIVAADADEDPLDNINGTFEFSINGFKEELKFNDGIAIASRPVDKSTFVYIKHKNDDGNHAKLYYVLKNDNGLNPFKINWMVLLIIPVSLILLGMMFRKFIMIAIILLAVLFFFNHSKGLDISTFFETIYNGVRSIF